MSTDHFRASVQYGDWEGTAAADDADQRTFGRLLEERGLFDPTREMLIGVELWIGENHGGKVEKPYLHAVFVEGDRFDNVAPRLKAERDPIKVRRIDVGLTLEEFIGLFKRFSVVITRRGMDLTDREYQWED